MSGLFRILSGQHPGDRGLAAVARTGADVDLVVALKAAARGGHAVAFIVRACAHGRLDA